MTQRVDSRQPHVAILLKTNEGGLWIRAQVEELLRRGARVSLIIPPGPGQLKRHLSDLNINVVDSPFNFSFKPVPSTFVGLFRLRRLIRLLQPSVVFYHLYASALAGRLSTAFLRIPRVHMVAGPLYLESPLISRVEGVLRAMDSVIISGSDFTYRAYEKLKGLRPGRHESIAYGVDSTRFDVRNGPRESLRGALGMKSNAFTAVMVAYTYAPKQMLDFSVGVKGHELLLQAWKSFHAQHPEDTELYIVGSGFDEAGEKHRQRLIAQQVSGITWVDTVEDVRDYYHASDVSVSPSVSENHGAAMEAGACGCPQIVSEAGGLPEMVNETSGWVYPVFDVDALANRLNEAYEAWSQGTLNNRALEARRHISSSFDAALCAAKVVDVILDAEHSRGRWV